MSNMKILITGSFCSGKSTLSNLLHSMFENSVIVPEITREILSLYGQIDWGLTELRNYLFLKQIIEEEKASQLNINYTIIDSGIISIFAHDKVLLNKSINRKELLDYFSYKMYDFIFVCSHEEILIEDDGQRYVDEKLRENIYKEVIKTLQEMGISYYEIKGTIPQRMEKILNILK